MKSLLLALLFLAANATADEFSGPLLISPATAEGFLKTWDSPGDPALTPCKGVTVCWLGNNPSTPDVPTAPIDLVSITTEQANNFLWGIRSRLYHYSNVDGSKTLLASESAAIYCQAFKYGTAPLWCALSEAQCVNARGGCHVHEFDCMMNGRADPARDLRQCLFVVVGRARGADQPGPAETQYVINIVPKDMRPQDVSLRQGIVFQLDCTVNCLQIPAGSQTCYDGNGGDACTKFDPKTGWRGDWNERLRCWSFARHAITGETWRQCYELGYR